LIIVEHGDRVLFEGSIDRTISTIARTMGERGDPIGIFHAEITVEFPSKETSQ